MPAFPYPPAFRDPTLRASTHRIEEALLATRCSLERLEQLRAAWGLRPPEQRTLDVQTEILEEMVVSTAFHRQALAMVAKARRGPIFVTTWDARLDESRRALDEAAAWLRSAAIPWPEA